MRVGYADWESVYQDNVGWIYRWMLQRVGNRPDAEDLVAEVFLAALRPLRLSGSIGEVRSYLSVTARTVLARHLRHTLGREATALNGDALPGGGLGHAANSAARTRAEEILAALPERYRRVLELRYLGGCSVQEAATELGVSVGHAKVLQHRALRRAAIVAASA